MSPVLDDDGAEQIHAYAQLAWTQWITYGMDDGADLRAVRETVPTTSGIVADLVWWNAPAGQLRLQCTRPPQRSQRTGRARCQQLV